MPSPFPRGFPTYRPAPRVRKQETARSLTSFLRKDRAVLCLRLSGSDCSSGEAEQVRQASASIEHPSAEKSYCIHRSGSRDLQQSAAAQYSNRILSSVSGGWQKDLPAAASDSFQAAFLTVQEKSEWNSPRPAPARTGMRAIKPAGMSRLPHRKNDRQPETGITERNPFTCSKKWSRMKQNCFPG